MLYDLDTAAKLLSVGASKLLNLEANEVACCSFDFTFLPHYYL